MNLISKTKRDANSARTDVKQDTEKSAANITSAAKKATAGVQTYNTDVMDFAKAHPGKFALDTALTLGSVAALAIPGVGEAAVGADAGLLGADLGLGGAEAASTAADGIEAAGSTEAATGDALDAKKVGGAVKKVVSKTRESIESKPGKGVMGTSIGVGYGGDVSGTKKGEEVGLIAGIAGLGAGITGLASSLLDSGGTVTGSLGDTFLGEKVVSSAGKVAKKSASSGETSVTSSGANGGVAGSIGAVIRAGVDTGIDGVDTSKGTYGVHEKGKEDKTGPIGAK